MASAVKKIKIERDRFTEEASMKSAVFIYSLGPFSVTQQIASWGTYPSLCYGCEK